MAETISVKDGHSVFTRLDSERDTARILAGLRRRWWVILLVGVLAAAGAYVVARGKTKEYEATSALWFTNEHFDQVLFNNSGSVFGSTDPTREAATNQALVALPTISMQVAHDLHIPYGLVRSEVNVGSDATSDVLNISVIDPNPNRAAAIANTYADDYVSFRKDQQQAQLAQAEALVKTALAKITPAEQNSPATQNLEQRSLDLRLLANLQTGDASRVLTATPSHSAVSPTPKRDGIIGFVLGLLVGTGLVALLERRDRRLKFGTEVEELYSVPILGTIPESSALTMPGAVGSAQDREAFSMMRAQLRYFDVDRDIKRVLVSSADMGEGKSVIALNLARSAAQTRDRRALLIETDLRRPSLGRMIGSDAVAGLTELLGHTQDLASGLRELVVTAEGLNGNGEAHFDILLAGGIPPNPAELLQSHRMSELLNHAEELYDLVVVDTPPIGIISDAIPLVHQVDGVLVVSRLGYSRRDRAVRLMKQLRGLSANVLGVVVNGSQEAARGYYGYYSAGSERAGLRRTARARAGRD